MRVIVTVLFFIMTLPIQAQEIRGQTAQTILAKGKILHASNGDKTSYVHNFTVSYNGRIYLCRTLIMHQSEKDLMGVSNLKYNWCDTFPN